MRVPISASPEVQQAFREIWEKLDEFFGGKNVDLGGRRLINAGNAVDAQDYATKHDLAPAGTEAQPLVVDVATVTKVLTVLNLLRFRTVAVVNPAAGVLRVVKSDGATLAEIQGLDLVVNNHASLVAAADTVLEVKTATGAAYATMKALKFTPSAPQTYSPTTVTPRRGGDFSALTTDQVRDIVGTLLQDLQTWGLLGT